MACYMNENKSRWFRLFVVGGQIGSLTNNPSFGHNLCFKYPNGSCEPILNIYVSRDFQCYKELFNSMNIDPCNYLLKIRESIRTPTSKVGAHLGVCEFIFSHSLTFQGAWNVILGLQLLARTFVSPYFGCKPKTTVLTFFEGIRRQLVLKNHYLHV